MFYIDGISLNKIKDELKNELLGKKINKIVRNTELSLSIFFGKLELVFSCNPNFPICYISNSKEQSLDTNSGLVDNLKKHLINAMLIDIEQLGFDRILVFKFAKLNELGEKKLYKIYFELMGKYSNFIFTEENNRIIDLLKRFSLESNRLRALFPGITYEQPIIQKKISPFQVTEEMFFNFKEENSLLTNIEGIGKNLLKNLANFSQFTTILSSKIAPKLFILNEKVIFGTVLDMEFNINHDEIKNFNSFRECINHYIEQNQLSTAFDTLKSQLTTNVLKKIKKNNKILEVLTEEREEKKDFEKFKEYGDILASSIYSVKKGATFIETYDFYNDKMIKIPLEPQKTPQENLEFLYKKYNKLKRSILSNQDRTLQINDELNYLIGVKLFIETSQNIDNLRNIEQELISQGYIKISSKKSKVKKQNKNIDYGIIEFDDFQILYGRNNVENENLTFKVADKSDIWLHAKNIPGSHVIIKTHTLTDEMILQGAKIAAKYSKAEIGEKVSVDYTEKKYINKPKGAKPGFVTYINEKNIVVVK